MSHTATCALGSKHTHEDLEHYEHDHLEVPDHSHGLVDRSILRSRAGMRAVSISLAVLSATAFAQTVIYTNAGSAYDIGTRRVLGTYPSTGSVAPDPTTRRVLFLANEGDPIVSTYGMDTFSPTGSEKLPMGTGYQRDLVRWGRHGYAFTGRQVLVIVRSKLVPTAP